MKAKTSASLGNISLMVSIGGLIATEIAIRNGLVAGGVWKVLLGGFEAATVGGIADWFAVSALFREVPIPLIRRHTNIIIKNRKRIVEGIADMVENRWLAPHIIREHLAHFSASRTVLDYLASNEHLENVLIFVRDLLQQIGSGIDRPEVVAFLERVMHDHLRDIQFAEPFGRWLGQYLKRGDHDAAWETLLTAIEYAVCEPEIKRGVQKMMENALDEYKANSFLKRIVKKRVRELVREENLATTFLSKLEEEVRAIRSDREHPARARIDAFVIEFADKLAAGEAPAVSIIETIRIAFVERADLREMLQRALRRFSERIERELGEINSDLDKVTRKVFQERLDLFRANRAVQENVDEWVRNIVLELVEKRHDMIGQMVRGSLEKLSDLDLVGQIENKVGQDLQYIRLNGAIVGGVAGAVLAITKLLM
jgi:uncharacterized membrane-anchored protein YjiN (DUF445 family)